MSNPFCLYLERSSSSSVTSNKCVRCSTVIYNARPYVFLNRTVTCYERARSFGVQIVHNYVLTKVRICLQ